MYKKRTIEELMNKGPGASKDYGDKYVVHWFTNAGDHMGRPTLALTSEGTKISYHEIEVWAKSLKGLWRKPCNILSEINIPTTTTFRNGDERHWYVTRLVVYEKDERSNGATQLYLF